MPYTRSQLKITHFTKSLSTNVQNMISKIDKENDPMSSILQAATHGLKRKADGRAILGEVKNNKNILQTRRPLGKKGLNLPKSKSQGAKATTTTVLPSSTIHQDENEVVYTGHKNLFIVPLHPWQLELRDEMIKNNTFYDHEATTQSNHFESPELALGIFEYMKWREEKFEISPYFENQLQTDFHEQDRKTLVDWMVEFQEIQETTHETLYLAVRLCDYFFAKQKVSRDKLQLYAFVGFLLASKFEERWPPTFEDMIYLSEDSYKREDFIQAELQMLKILDFDLNAPVSYRYLRRYSKCIGMDMKSLTVARFYLELTLPEYEYVSEKQSHLAAAALWISLTTLGYDSKSRKLTTTKKFTKNYWSNLLSYYTGVHEWEIIKLARRLANTVRSCQDQCKHIKVNEDKDDPTESDESDEKLCTVVYKKYASETFFEVATIRLLTDEQIGIHVRRCDSERIDYEAQQEPNVKRRSSGCTSSLRKMTLRGSTTPQAVPEKSKIMT